MKILVTGAAGFIGSNLSIKLKELGHEVVAIDSFDPHYNPKLKLINADDVRKSGVEVLKRDIVTDSLDDILEGVEAVYHLAAQPGISKAPFELYERNNIVATNKLLNSVKDLGLKAFFNIGTSSIYGSFATVSEDNEVKPTSYYGVTKLTAEQLALALNREAGFPAISFRLFSVIGERERPEKFIPQVAMSIMTDREVIYYQGSENHVRSFTYVGDIVNGFVLGLNNIDKCVGQIINLGNDRSRTTGEVLAAVENVLGKKAKVVRPPRRYGDQEKTEAIIDKARTLLGYSPETQMEEAVRRQVEWLKNNVLGKVDFWEKTTNY